MLEQCKPSRAETIQLMDGEDYASYCSEDGELHGAPTTEETQLLNCDRDLRDAGLDDQRSSKQHNLVTARSKNCHHNNKAARAKRVGR